MNALHLATGQWDLISALNNATAYIKVAGGGLLVLLGVGGVVWGGVLLIKKLMHGQQNQDSWIRIISLLMIGGALAVGGFGLIMSIASGGKKTVDQLGGGTVLFSQTQLTGPHANTHQLP